ADTTPTAGPGNSTLGPAGCRTLSRFCLVFHPVCWFADYPDKLAHIIRRRRLKRLLQHFGNRIELRPARKRIMKFIAVDAVIDNSFFIAEAFPAAATTAADPADQEPIVLDLFNVNSGANTFASNVVGK